MGLKVRLNLQVEALGSTFHMRPHDGSWARFVKAGAEFGQAAADLRDLDIDTDAGPTQEQWATLAAMPLELITAVCDLFVQGCIGWKGVTDEDDMEIPCNLANKQALDTQDKLTIGFAYLAALEDVEAKKVPPEPLPTAGTPPEE